MNHTGILDLVPTALREEWKKAGYYPNRTVYQMFCSKAADLPDTPAVLEPDCITSYAQLRDAAQRIAGSFKALGIVNGDVVVYQLANSWRSCAIDLACAALGAVACPMPAGRGRLDMESVLKRTDARAVIVDRRHREIDYCEIVDDVRRVALSLRVLVVHGEKPDTGSWRSFDDLLQAEPLTEFEAVNADSPARFLISSGTESEPKLVAYSHNALLGGRGRFLERMKNPEQDFRALYLMPLGTAFGSSATCGVLAWLGGSIVVLPEFSAEAAIDAITQHRPTHVLGVPTMFQRMAVAPELQQVDLSCLTALVSGGAAMDSATRNRCARAFSCPLIGLYGSADGINCHHTLNDPPETLDTSIGRPNPSVCDIRIVDDERQPLPRGETGEIAGRGPLSPMQYVNAPELDRSNRDEQGWVYTGDLGRIDDAGNLVLLGRKKEVIIRGGSNISPVQIEQIATAHPDVVSVACVPVPDAEMGQRVCICLTLRDGAERMSLRELGEFLKSRGLEVNKLPEYLQFHRQLPMTPAGKVDKRALTAGAANLGDAPVEPLKQAI